jgi:coenzyme F420-reducing hydrogenase alpha subunit
VSTEGTLTLRLTVANGRVSEVDVLSTRPVRAAAALAGRAAEDVLRLVPLLFPVCGVAQGVACARAIEAALGTAAGPVVEAARELVCLGEAAASHVWQLAIAWPEAAGVATDVGAVREALGARVALSLALFGEKSGGAALGGTSRIGAPDATRLADAKLAVTTLCALVDRLTASDPALIAEVTRAGRAAFGASTTRALETLDTRATSASLAADPDFAEHPLFDGAPADVSAYARCGSSEAVQAVEATHGRGLLARLVARHAGARADARTLAARFADFEESLTTGGLDRAKATAVEAAKAAAVEAAKATAVEATAVEAAKATAEHEAEARTGGGAAETARGPLVYWVRASPTKIHDVRVVAPTDWTFHPRGALESALVGAEASPTLARDAGWLMLALDPCVPWKVEVRDA